MTSIKKQSIPTVQQGGLKKSAVVSPINKMGVKTSESMHSHMQDRDLPFQENSLYAIPYQKMVMTSKGVKPVESQFVNLLKSGHL